MLLPGTVFSGGLIHNRRRTDYVGLSQNKPQLVCVFVHGDDGTLQPLRIPDVLLIVSGNNGAPWLRGIRFTGLRVLTHGACWLDRPKSYRRGPTCSALTGPPPPPTCSAYRDPISAGSR